MYRVIYVWPNNTLIVAPSFTVYLDILPGAWALYLYIENVCYDSAIVDPENTVS